MAKQTRHASKTHSPPPGGPTAQVIRQVAAAGYKVPRLLGKKLTIKQPGKGARQVLLQEQRTAKGKRGRRGRRQQPRAKDAIVWQLREWLLPLTSATRFWHKRLDCEMRALTLSVRQAYMRCEPLRAAMSYSRFSQRIGIRHTKCGIIRQKKREDSCSE